MSVAMLIDDEAGFVRAAAIVARLTEMKVPTDLAGAVAWVEQFLRTQGVSGFIGGRLPADVAELVRLRVLREQVATAAEALGLPGAATWEALPLAAG